MSSVEAKAKVSQRKQVRYAVSEDCRLRATIMIRSSDEGSTHKTWTGTLVDLSPEGAHLHMSLGSLAYAGDRCVLTLSHGGIKKEINGSVAHYTCAARHSVCGVRFDLSSAAADKAYQPFFRAIVAGASLAAGPAGTESPVRHREEFNGPSQAKLVVWRDKPGGTLVGFEFTMARFAASLASVGSDMAKNKEQVRFRLAEGGTGTALTKMQELEARWEFSLAGSNLPEAIAPDIRQLLRSVS
jgi:PilZ domain